MSRQLTFQALYRDAQRFMEQYDAPRKERRKNAREAARMTLKKMRSDEKEKP